MPSRRRQPASAGPPEGVALRRLLRRAVFDFVATRTSRVYPPQLWVGIPGEEPVCHTLTEPVNRRTRIRTDGDHALRVDQVSALAVRSASAYPIVWLIREGCLTESQDMDADWLAAARQAFAEMDKPLVFVTVNQRGWRDPRSGEARTWARVRLGPNYPRNPVGIGQTSTGGTPA